MKVQLLKIVIKLLNTKTQIQRKGRALEEKKIPDRTDDKTEFLNNKKLSLKEQIDISQAIAGFEKEL